jgi:hypothetical protein
MSPLPPEGCRRDSIFFAHELQHYDSGEGRDFRGMRDSIYIHPHGHLFVIEVAMAAKLFLVVTVLGLGSLMFVTGCASPLAAMGGMPISTTGAGQPVAVSARAMTPHDPGDHASWYRWNQPSYDYP